MSKRLGGFRLGDRAEGLGLELLRSFCAVAPNPRPEDFGLMDGVATLLRREGDYWHPEDAFIVQIKSRGDQDRGLDVNYRGEGFLRLQRSRLPVFIGLVDLANAKMELHSVGVALNSAVLAGPVTGIACRFHYKRVKAGVRNGVLHRLFSDPILTVSASDLADQAVADHAYHVMKEWLAIEAWNNRYRSIGLFKQVSWKCGDIPKVRSHSFKTQTKPPPEVLEQIWPSIEFLNVIASSTAERATLVDLQRWMSSLGCTSARDRLSMSVATMAGWRETRAKGHNDGPVLVLAVTWNRPNYIDFVVGGNGYRGVPESLCQHGFEFEFDDTGTAVAVDVAKWLWERGFAGRLEGVDMIRCVPTKEEPSRPTRVPLPRY